MLTCFFHPKSIVLFGISRNKTKSGNVVLQNMKLFKSEHLFILHPKADEIEEYKCVKSFNEIDEKYRYNIDLAIIVLPVQYVKDTTIECIKYGVKGIIIESGDIAFNADDKDQYKKEIFDAIENNKTSDGSKTRIMGPNSIGVLNNKINFFTPITPMTNFPPYNKFGGLSIIAQTGLLLSGYLIDYFESRNTPITYVSAIGNKLDIDESDLLEYFMKDPMTKAISMYLEGIKDGRRFFRLCNEAIYKYGKTLVLLKSGKSELGKKAMLSHTNSLAGNSEISNAMCKQLGIIQVTDLTELILAGKLATLSKPPKGPNLGIVSISGAGCVLSSDLAERFGLKLPPLSDEILNKMEDIFPKWMTINHPVDMWPSIEQHGAKISYNTTLSAFLESGLFDFIILGIIAGSRATLDYEFIRNIQTKYPEIPLILLVFGGYDEIKRSISKEFENVENGSSFISSQLKNFYFMPNI